MIDQNTSNTYQHNVPILKTYKLHAHTHTIHYYRRHVLSCTTFYMYGYTLRTCT